MDSLLPNRFGPVCCAHGIRGYGNPDSGVVIVGIAPGANEIKQGKPLVGQSGKLIDSILREVNWPRENTYCTNLVCWQNNEPTYEESRACFPRLLEELAACKPKLIVTIGKIPCEYLFGRDFTSTRGAVLWNDLLKCWTLATYHPAAILRGGSYYIHDLIRDLAKIPDILTWSKDRAKVDYDIADNSRRAQWVLNNLPKNRYISLDIETSNPDVDDLDVFEDKMLCLAMSDGIRTWVFPASVLPGLKWPEGIQWVFHNGVFDTQGMKKYLGVDLPIVEDTMLMSYSLDERRRKGLHSLKGLSREYMASGFYEETVKKQRKGKLNTVPVEQLYEYNAKDAAYTARLAEYLKPMQVQDNVRDMYKKILIPAANAFKEITLRGIYVDPKKLDELESDWIPRYVTEEKGLQDYAESMGYPGKINLRSPVQLSHFLYGILRLPGGPSTDKAHLEPLANNPFVKRFQDFRALGHILTTYVAGVKDDIKIDSRVHPDVMIIGTETGRLSYVDPPMQTIPKAVKVGEDLGRIKQIFAVENPEEYIIIEADFKQAEIWGAYAHSKDPQMLADLLSGDYHRQVASTIFHKNPEDVTKLEREKAKPVSFGLLYGRQAMSLALGELDCPVVDAQHYMDSWWARYPVYKKWFEDTRKAAQEEGEVVALTGRKRRFKLMVDNAYEEMNSAVNFPIQSLASDLALLALIDLHKELKQYESYVLLAVHDSIVFEIKRQYRAEAIELIHKYMSMPERYPGLPGIPIDLKEGINWGDMKEIDG